MKLLTIIQKNFRIFIRSKVSALIIFLGPLLLVSLIGLSFSNTQLPGLTVGTYSPNYNDFTNSIVAKISANNFNIHKYDSREQCSDAVKRSEAAICLVFPENMDTTNNEVSFIVDYSKINLVFIVVDIFSNKVSERATELRQSYATDLLSRVIQTKDDLTKEITNLGSLNTKQGDAKTTLGTAQSSLDDINPDSNLGGVSIDTAKSSLATITTNVDSAEGKVASARLAVSDSDLADSDKSSINSKLSDAGTSLTQALIYLEGNRSTASLVSIISALDGALSNAKAQLDQIKAKKTALQGDFITLNGSLSDSISQISALNTAAKATFARIENVQSSDVGQLVSPIKTKIEPVTTQETHFNYLFPTLIVLVIMITAVLLSSTLVMGEKKSKSMFRNFITPTSDWIFNLGTFLTAFLAILIQLVIFFVISYFFFDTNILSSLGSSLLVLVLITSAFILLGMLIGYVFKSEETYVLASITVSALLLFLSSTVMPIESISNSVRVFASYTPFVISESLLRQVMFFNFSLVSLWVELLVLAGYIAVFYGLIFAIHKLGKYTFTLKKKEVKK